MHSLYGSYGAKPNHHPRGSARRDPRKHRQILQHQRCRPQQCKPQCRRLDICGNETGCAGGNNINHNNCGDNSDSGTETTSAPADATGVNQESESQRTVSSTQASYSFTESKIGTFEPSVEFGLALGQFLGDGAKFGDEHMFKLTFGIHGAFGAKYFITEKFFAEALIGYRYLDGIGNRKTFELIYGDGAHGEFTTHSIYIPLYFGAKVNKLTFKAGPYFDNIVKGKYVAERPIGNFKQTVKVKDGKFSVGLNFCAAYDNYGVKFNIGLSDYGGKILDGGAKEMAFGIFMIF